MFEKFAEITVFSIEFEVEVLHLKLYCSRFELCTENDTAPTLNFNPDNGEQASLRIKCVVVLRPWPNLLIQIIPEGSITTKGRSFCVDEVSLLSFFETIPMELGNGLLEFTKATNQHRVVLTADTT